MTDGAPGGAAVEGKENDIRKTPRMTVKEAIGGIFQGGHSNGESVIFIVKEWIKTVRPDDRKKRGRPPN